MDSKSRYRSEKLVLYLSKSFIMLVFSCALYFVWLEYYNPYIPKPFYEYGNYLLFAVFVAVYYAFVKVYGGFMVGTAQVHDLIFSQIIAIGFQQGILYVIFSLLSYRLVSPLPFFIMFVLFSAFASLWAVVTDALYFRFHAPKKTVVVFENVDSYLSLKGIRSIDKRFTHLPPHHRHHHHTEGH